MSVKLLSENKVSGGWHCRYQHASTSTACDMTFAVFFPPLYEQNKALPVLYWLSGLTCTDENFMQKSGVQKYAAQLGIIVVAPDTSPRGEGVPDDPEGAYDMGLGAGFYLNALQEPWKQHYQMYDYVVNELPTLIEHEFSVSSLKSISGHSMGGHGALTIGFKNIDSYQSISAFSPICNPTNCSWGQKAFSRYLGEDRSLWAQYDACELIDRFSTKTQLPILVDQGSNDNFLTEQLMSERLQAAAQASGVDLKLRMQAEYDHSYYFIASFIEEHLDFHAQYLVGSASNKK